jgi:Tol biopolymer transport system component
MTVSADGTKAIVMDFSKGQNLALYDLAKKQTHLVTDLDWDLEWVYYAAWSPDARRVAYLQTNGPSRGSELRVATLDGRSSAVHCTANPNVQPVGWTPDGATLLVTLARPDRTWAIGTVPVAGGPFTALRSFGWSFDAREGSPGRTCRQPRRT